MRYSEREGLVLSGWKKWFHKLFLFITYPVRKPWFLLLILVGIYLMPTFRGVKPTEVHVWYLEKIKNWEQKFATKLTDIKEQEMPAIISGPKGTDKLVDYDAGQNVGSARKTFGKASEAPKVVDIMENKDEDVTGFVNEVKEDNISVKNDNILIQEETKEYKAPEPTLSDLINSAQPKTPTKAEIAKKLSLVYLDTPKEVSGAVYVSNANTLTVNGTYLFLYGIYVDPNTSKGIEARQYLAQLVKGHSVRCSIVAYTYQDIPTAICYMEDNKNINQILIDENLSNNIAL